MAEYCGKDWGTAAAIIGHVRAGICHKNLSSAVTVCVRQICENAEHRNALDQQLELRIKHCLTAILLLHVPVCCPVHTAARLLRSK